jgi:hypothetical protein
MDWRRREIHNSQCGTRGTQQDFEFWSIKKLAGCRRIGPTTQLVGKICVNRWQNY